jgi:hypothetical protein
MKRWAPVIAVAALAALVAAPAASAGDAVEWDRSRKCSNAVGNFGQREVPIGSVAFVRAVNGYANPAFWATRRDPDTGRYWAKAPIAVRNGKTVTVSIARSDRRVGDLQFMPSRSGGADLRKSVRFTACPRGRATGDRGWSSWPGGFVLDGPACLDLVAREVGSRRVHRATLSFGMGDAC